MKICVLGNSHVASLKQGYEAFKPRHPELSLTFFAARGRDLLGLKPSGSCLIPVKAELADKIAFTSGGLRAVNLPEFDCCLIYGMRLMPRQMESRTSAAVKNQACRDNLAASPAHELARRVRAISTIPILIGHEPLSCLRGSVSPERSSLDYEEILYITRAQLHIKNAVLLAQPPDTIGPKWHTKECFTSNAHRLNLGDIKSDRVPTMNDGTHMNGEFGEIYLESIIDFLHAH